MLMMIATVRGMGNKLVGFKLLDTHSTKTTVILYRELLEKLQQNKASVHNLTVCNKKIKGVNGAIERYTILDQNLKVVSKAVVVILYKGVNGEYICANQDGVLQNSLTEEELVKEARLNGLANGKVVNNHISAIEGSYSVLPF